MSSEEQTAVATEVENATKESDSTNAITEDTVNEVNDNEKIPQLNEQPTTPKDEENKSETTTTIVLEENGNDEKINNKRNIDEVNNGNEKTNGQHHDEDGEATVSTTTNKKMKMSDPLASENDGNADEASLANDNVPNDGVTVV